MKYTAHILRMASGPVAAALWLVGCASRGPVAPPDTLPAPAPAHATAMPAPAADAPDLQARLREATLADVVDIALRNNPATRAAWAEAMAAGAAAESARAAYYPVIGLDGALLRLKAADSADRPASPATTATAALNLSCLLLDAGGRSAALDGARQAVLTARARQDVAVQDVILQTESAYFLYMATRALRDAQLATLAEAQTNLNVAVARHEAELATLADVLQARTVVARAQLAVQGTQGNLQTTRGALVLSMGLPAHTPCDVAALPPDVPVQSVTTQVVDLIERALLSRPDLAAEAARVRAAEARVRQLVSAGRPALRATGSVGRSYDTDGMDGSDTYGAGLALHIPLFTGYAASRDIDQARWLAMAEGERAQLLEQRAVYEVFKAYYDLQTAAQRAATADEMMASAGQAHDATLGLYQQGLGSITDLLSAQALLAEARGQRIEARWAWWTACAQLAHDMGIISSGANPTRDLNLPGEKP